MSESAFGRFGDKPPEDGKGPVVPPHVLELRRRQRRLVIITVGVIFALGAGAGVFAYIESAPQRSDKEFQEGMKMMRPGKYPDAVVHFTRALSIGGQRADAYMERGNAHRALDETDAALADFQAAADVNPSLAEAHSGLAMIYLLRNDSRHALEELNKSIALEPNIEAYYQRGEILESQGEHQKAIADYDQAISVARDAPYMYRARAMAKEKLGDMEGAHADRLAAAELEKR